MICTFFGHRDAPDFIYQSLKVAIIDLINEGVIEFYVGNDGNYDRTAQKVLVDIIKQGYKINLTVILSRIDERAFFAAGHQTLLPEELEKALPRFAISKRNEWMIKNADVVITYVKHKFSNSYNWQEKARKKGLQIIYLANKI